MHTDMTAVTIQSNKIVSNAVKENSALLEPSYGKNITDLLANPSYPSGRTRRSGVCEKSFTEEVELS